MEIGLGITDDAGSADSATLRINVDVSHRALHKLVVKALRLTSIQAQLDHGKCVCERTDLSPQFDS